MSNRRLYQLDHCTYQCDYHLVWTTRYRGMVMADNYIKQLLGQTFKRICHWKGLRPWAWHIGDEHIHIFLCVPPKYSISYVVNVLKGKSSAWIKKKTKKIPKGSFWARGYFVSTVGVDEMTVKRYVENQRHHQVEFPKLPFV